MYVMCIWTVQPETAATWKPSTSEALMSELMLMGHNSYSLLL